MASRGAEAAFRVRATPTPKNAGASSVGSKSQILSVNARTGEQMAITFRTKNPDLVGSKVRVGAVRGCGWISGRLWVARHATNAARSPAAQ